MEPVFERKTDAMMFLQNLPTTLLVLESPYLAEMVNKDAIRTVTIAALDKVLSSGTVNAAPLLD